MNANTQLSALLEDEIPHLKRYARTLADHGHDADDLVQATLERALIYAATWDPDRRLRPWLFRIEHNLYISWVRRKENEYVYHRIDDIAELVDTSAGMELSAEMRTIQRALAALPVAQQSVIVLIIVEGFSYEEASEALCVPVGTIRSRLSRGRESLRTMILRE